MTIYHGSNLIVKSPELRFSVRNLDFGTAFYTTTNEKQAIQFAQKVYKRAERQGIISEGCFVSSYTIDYERMKNEIDILTFEKPDEAWLDFVMANRRNSYAGKKYDVIFGSVANDTVYRALIGYETGLYTKSQTIEQLAVRKLFNQMAFASNKAISFLHYTAYKEVSAWNN
jgi:hypothetical protein